MDIITVNLPIMEDKQRIKEGKASFESVMMDYRNKLRASMSYSHQEARSVLFNLAYGEKAFLDAMPASPVSLVLRGHCAESRKYDEKQCFMYILLLSAYTIMLMSCVAMTWHSWLKDEHLYLINIYFPMICGEIQFA